jgi:predicted acylesterase/phospholipase RssA
VGDFRGWLMNQPAASTAVVLSGGGAYGAFGIGVMKTLFAGRSPATDYAPLVPNIYTGTSVGAFNAALMASQPCGNFLDSASWLEQIWLELVADRPGRCGNGIFRVRGNPADLVDLGCLRDPVGVAARFAGDTAALGFYLLARTANFLASSDPLEDRMVALVNLGSFVDSRPFQDLLHEVIKEKNIQQSPLTLRITTTDWVTGTIRYFSNSDFQDGLGILAIMASAAIPGIFPPVRIGRDVYVDGGVVENTPLNSAIEAGATNLHVIYLDPNPRFMRLRGEPNSLETLLRVYYVMLAANLTEDIKTAKRLNVGLDAITNFQQGQTISETAMQDLIRAAGEFIGRAKTNYKRLIIHRYFPEETLGSDLGMLDFSLDAIVRMIGEGERIALVHDCRHNGCVL